MAVLEDQPVLEAAAGPVGEVVGGEVGGLGAQGLDDVGVGEPVVEELVELFAGGGGEAGDFAGAATRRRRQC